MIKRTLTTRQAKKLDSKAKDRFGVPTILLMENAGRAVSEEVIKNIPVRKSKIAIFCGRGNNGGDGLCAARHLMAKGLSLDVYLCGRHNQVKGEAKVNLDILLKLKKDVFEINQRTLKLIKRKIHHYGLIVDALLGVGLRGEVSGIDASVINLINSSSAQVISVDIPSGLDANSGKALGSCIKADKTVTFIAEKRGMGKGKDFCQEIIIKDLGIPL